MMKLLKPLFLVTTCFVMLAACNNSNLPAAKEQSDLSFKHGVELAHKGEFDQAINAFEQALEHQPARLAALYNIGLSYSNKGMVDLEERYYRKAIDMAPKASEEERQQVIPSVYYNLAILMLKQEDKTRAFDYLDQGLEIEPNRNSWYHDMIGDSDLDPVRDDPRFKELMKKYWPPQIQNNTRPRTQPSPQNISGSKIPIPPKPPMPDNK